MNQSKYQTDAQVSRVDASNFFRILSEFNGREMRITLNQPRKSFRKWHPLQILNIKLI